MTRSHNLIVKPRELAHLRNHTESKVPAA